MGHGGATQLLCAGMRRAEPRSMHDSPSSRVLVCEGGWVGGCCYHSKKTDPEEAFNQFTAADGNPEKQVEMVRSCSVCVSGG